MTTQSVFLDLNLTELNSRINTLNLVGEQEQTSVVVSISFERSWGAYKWLIALCRRPTLDVLTLPFPPLLGSGYTSKFLSDLRHTGAVLCEFGKRRARKMETRCCGNGANGNVFMDLPGETSGECDACSSMCR